MKQLFWIIFENLVVKPESVEELPPLLPSLSMIKEIYQDNVFWSHAWKWGLAMKKGKFSTSLRNPTSPQRISMLRSAPWGNESKIAKHTALKQERLLLISRWSGCKFCQGLGPLCMNYKEENKKWNLLILRAPSSQKTEEIWLENCTKNVNLLQICMFAQMKIVEVEFTNIWRLNILWWPEMEDSLSSGEVPAAAKAIPPPIEWPICWIFFIK